MSLPPIQEHPPLYLMMLTLLLIALFILSCVFILYRLKERFQIPVRNMVVFNSVFCGIIFLLASQVSVALAVGLVMYSLFMMAIRSGDGFFYSMVNLATVLILLGYLVYSVLTQLMT